MNDGVRSSIEAAPSVRGRVSSSRPDEHSPNDRARHIRAGHRIESAPARNDGQPALGRWAQDLADRRRSSVEVADPLHRVRIPLPILIIYIDGVTRSKCREITKDGETVLPVNVAADD